MTSNDCNDAVQIWGAETALLKAVCKGHEAELTDLAASADNAIVASSSMDWSIRCWSLQVAIYSLAIQSDWQAITCRGNSWSVAIAC